MRVEFDNKITIRYETYVDMHPIILKLRDEFPEFNNLINFDNKKFQFNNEENGEQVIVKHDKDFKLILVLSDNTSLKVVEIAKFIMDQLA